MNCEREREGNPKGTTNQQGTQKNTSKPATQLRTPKRGRRALLSSSASQINRVKSFPNIKNAPQQL